MIKGNIQDYHLGLRNDMAKRKSLIGVNNFVRQTKKKRPGRHAKRPNKHAKKNMKRYRGQGR